jgi:alginate O-acetyltransferase complex protein AlgI
MSLLFYAWGEPRFVIVMVAVVMLDYVCGLWIEYARHRYGLITRRLIFFLTLLINLAPLLYYKYFNFFIENLNMIPGVDISVRDIILPIGISFYTFQAMSYVIDLYLGQIKVQKNPLNLLLYVSLFPQLIAGPIVRYKDVSLQLRDRTTDAAKFAEGVKRFIIGLAKKVIIANQVALVVDNIFSLPPNENSMATAWVGIICYTIQIYFDFSGYSDMAIGLGKMFGFDFHENFLHPYAANSMTTFWRKWHVSMSSWFRDYVYIPLGGNRRGNVYIHLIIVFFATGLWHGASWNFVVWGLWHGCFLILERINVNRVKGKIRNMGGGIAKISSAIRWLYMIMVVMIGWVLFRSPDLQYAANYLGVMFGIVAPENVGFTVLWYLNPKIMFYIGIAALASAPWKHIYSEKFGRLQGIGAMIFFERALLILLLGFSIMMVMTSTYNPFIYFRF